MPLDSGAVTRDTVSFAGAESTESPPAVPPTLSGAVTVGAGLRAAREFLGLSRQDLADSTRIRANYLAAIEDMKLDQLPSRPFTIGYVRAYAQALNLDPDEAVAKFKHDAPVTAEPLRPPVGVSHERDPRLTLAAAAGAVVVTAVLIWNLAQHAVAKEDPTKAPVPDSGAVAAASTPSPVASGKPVVLSAAEPAPQDSDVPVPYVTPGLAADVAAQNPPAPGAAAAPAPVEAAVVEALPPAPATFHPKGAVYGAEPAESQLTLQARKPASLVIRGGDGTVYFARQLAAGEAYRAPTLKGLTVDVSDPLAFSVYSGGALTGGLQAAQTPIGKLGG